MNTWIPALCYMLPQIFVTLHMKRVTMTKISFFSTVRQKKTIVLDIFIFDSSLSFSCLERKVMFVHNFNCNHKPYLLSCFSMIN